MGKEKPITINETLDRVILDSSERVFSFAKKRFRNRLYFVFFVAVAASVGFAFYSLFVKANIFSYYPSSCLGTWDNPQNAQGEPSLEPGARLEEFNKDNSSFYDGGGAKQVFCGGFRGEGDETEKIFKKAILKFTWAIAAPLPSSSSGAAGGAPTQVLQQSEFESQALDLTASASIIVIPDNPASVSIPFESENQTPEPIPDSQQAPLNSEPPLVTTEQPTPVPEISVTPEPTPVPAPELAPPAPEPILENPPQPEPAPPASEPALPILSPTSSEKQNRGSSISQPDSSNPGEIGTEPPVSLLGRFTLASIFSDVASDSISPSASPTPTSVSQPSVKPSPSLEILISPSSSFTPTPASSPSLSTPLHTSYPTGQASQVDSLTASISQPADINGASVSYSLDDFLEVFYTIDGQNWQSLGRVNKDNFKNLELEVPIVSWEELGKLQISVAGIFTTDAGQKVYLDGMRIETEFEKMAEKEKKDINSDELVFQLERNLAKWNISKLASTSAQTLEFTNRITENEGQFYKIGDIDGDSVPDFAINTKNIHDEAGRYDFKKFEIYSGKAGGLIGQFEEAESEGHYYLIFSELPDINSDGISDYAVLDPGFSTGEGGAIANERGRITAHSGKDNYILWVYAGTTDYQFFGNNSVMKLGGDYDGDGLGDLLVSVPLYEKEGKKGAILIISSSKGELINSYQGKWATGDDSSAIYRFDIGPDLNSDGWPEIILGEIHNGPDGQDSKVSLLSGKDLGTIEVIADPDPDRSSYYFGVGVTFVNDESGDGIDDILVEAISKQPGPDNSLEKFSIFSSVDRSFITYYEE